ncbi:MAG TPA: pilus assembly protein PilN, partial [Thiotrichaceae bacterium]|nr:pilus assembly protein PilN [Thiotrichaceae bacterium]
MASLNLLPWREKAKEQSRKNFLMAVGASILAGAGAIFAANSWMLSNIDYQEQRNTRMKSEIRKLELTIADIKKLDSTRKALLDRISII